MRLPRESTGTARLCGADDERGGAAAEAQILVRVVAGKEGCKRPMRLLREATHRAFAITVTLRQVLGGEPVVADEVPARNSWHKRIGIEKQSPRVQTQLVKVSKKTTTWTLKLWRTETLLPVPAILNFLIAWFQANIPVLLCLRLLMGTRLAASANGVLQSPCPNIYVWALCVEHSIRALRESYADFPSH
jgi:hypothetical protein